MAGVFAVRALRAGREKFDPFREISSDEEDETNVDDIKGGALPGDDDEVAAPAGAAFSTSMKGVQSRWEKDAADKNVDAAFDVTDESPPSAAPPPQKPVTALAPSWETPCELLYEDDDAEVFCVRFNPEDKLLAAGCGDSVVRIFHCDDGRLAYNLDPELGGKARLPTTCLRWRPAAANAATKNILLAANADGTIQHWHVTSRKCLHTIREEDCNKGGTNQVYALDYNQEGTAFASAGKSEAEKSESARTQRRTQHGRRAHVHQHHRPPRATPPITPHTLTPHTSSTHLSSPLLPCQARTTRCAFTTRRQRRSPQSSPPDTSARPPPATPTASLASNLYRMIQCYSYPLDGIIQYRYGTCACRPHARQCTAHIYAATR